MNLHNGLSNCILLVWVLFLCSTKSKKRKSLVISAPIPCNTAFPSSPAPQSSAPSPPYRGSTSDDPAGKADAAPDETAGQGDSASDLESVSLTDSDTPSTHRLSISSEGEAPRTLALANENGPQNAESALGSTNQQEEARRSMDASKAQAIQQVESEAPKSPGAEKPKRPPLPTPRLSLTPSETTTPLAPAPASSNGQEVKEDEEEVEQQKQQPDEDASDVMATTADVTETSPASATTEESSGQESLVEKADVPAPLPTSDSDGSKPPGFLYKVRSPG